MKYKNLYVAATSQHVGKTTSTLGLVTAFMHQNIKVGYCKPVGQKFVDIQNLRVDKDAFLFSDVMQFELKPELHSPVILGQGVTADYLDHPEAYDFKARIERAAEQLQAEHELVIFEGTGHPGVGHVVNLPNDHVAKMVGAPAVMVVEGGIGSTIDMLNLCLSRFRKTDVPIIGVIVNKVRPDKMDRVEHYVNQWLTPHNIPLLGMLPYDTSMVQPLLKTVTEAVNGVVIYNEDALYNRVRQILAGSLITPDEMRGDDMLLVVSTMRVDTALEQIRQLSHDMEREGSPLCGIIATGQGSISSASINYIRKHNIPLIRTALDTYGTVLKISRIEVKINQRTPWKVQRAIEMIQANINLDLLLERLQL